MTCVWDFLGYTAKETSLLNLTDNQNQKYFNDPQREIAGFMIIRFKQENKHDR